MREFRHAQRIEAAARTGILAGIAYAGMAGVAGAGPGSEPATSRGRPRRSRSRRCPGPSRPPHAAPQRRRPFTSNPAPTERAPRRIPVKAKLASGIYHVPGGGNYDRTKPDRCYVDAEAAEADGLRAAKR